MVQKSPGRKLVGPPVMLQDWDTEAEELTSKYWELFLDLLLVAASASLADGLKANLTWGGLAEFVALYLMVTSGYMLYSPQITTRFEDASLSHAAMVFFYLLGIAICTLYTSFRFAYQFALGSFLQRAVVLCLLGVIYVHIERARAFCRHFGAYIFVAAVLLLVGFFVRSWAVPCLWVVVAIENISPFYWPRLLSKEDLIPINIEHTKDRLGCFILVMLGETVVSATITYRLLAATGSTIADVSRYYWTLGLSFLLIFAFTLLYFHMQPAPQATGFHRSRIRGIMLFTLHKVLGAALLGVGVAVRLMVEAVTNGVRMSDAGAVLTGTSVGVSLLTLLLIRVQHYGGLEGQEERYPPHVLVIFNAWWAIVTFFAAVPFVLVVFCNITDPVASVAIYSGMICTLCVVESGFTHYLEPYLAGGMESGEGDPLVTQEEETPPTYESTGTASHSLL